MINFLHTFNPESVLFQLGPFAIHWYGFLMVVGGLLGFFLILKLAPKYKIDQKFFHDLLFWWVVGAVIGARIYYVMYAWELYQGNWLDIFKIWQGGLAIHGIMIGGFVTTLIYSIKKGKDFWLIVDLIATGLVAAQVIGRIGNYFNQEIFGLPTNLPWGIPISYLHRPLGYLNFEYFHPTFLYESLGNIIILLFLLSLHFIRFKHRKWIAGNIFLIYIICYSCLRFLLEFFRLDYSPTIGGVRWAQIMSVLLIILAVIGLILRKIWQVKKKN